MQIYTTNNSIKMALTITLVDPNTPLSQGPGTINANFSAIKAEFDSIEGFLNPVSQTLRMTTLVGSIPTGGAEVATISVTKSSSVVLAIVPGGGGATATINADGTFTGLKFVATGTGVGDISTFNKVAINDATTITANITINGAVDFKGANTAILHKYATLTIVDANTGPSAVSPVDLSKHQYVFLDCSNSGGVLANSGRIKLDTTNMKDGHILYVHLAVKNTSAQSFYNGTSGSELFAYYNTAGAGITSISSSTYPTFTPSSTPNTQSWMKLQWQNIGGGSYRFVVLDHFNVTGVS